MRYVFPPGEVVCGGLLRVRARGTEPSCCAMRIRCVSFLGRQRTDVLWHGLFSLFVLFLWRVFFPLRLSHRSLRR